MTRNCKYLQYTIVTCLKYTRLIHSFEAFICDRRANLSGPELTWLNSVANYAG